MEKTASLTWPQAFVVGVGLACAAIVLREFIREVGWWSIIPAMFLIAALFHE